MTRLASEVKATAYIFAKMHFSGGGVRIDSFDDRQCLISLTGALAVHHRLRGIPTYRLEANERKVSVSTGA